MIILLLTHVNAMHCIQTEGLWYTIDLTDLLEKQGWDKRRNSSLISSAWKIYLVINIIITLLTVTILYISCNTHNLPLKKISMTTR